jgi:hypothetical protein
MVTSLTAEISGLDGEGRSKLACRRAADQPVANGRYDVETPHLGCITHYTSTDTSSSV